MKPVDQPLWDEQLFQLLSRVIDAVIYEQTPGLKTVLVAEYLTRTSRIEIAVASRRRLVRKRPSLSRKRTARQR